jgi:chromosome segregation ATPase
MRNRIGIVVLVLVSVGLGIALISVKRQAVTEKTRDTEKIVTLQTNLDETTGKLAEQKRVSGMLETDLETQKKSFGELTNTFSQVSDNLAKTEESLKATKEQVAKLEAKTAELESQNQVLDKRGQELTTSITNLTVQIADTQRRLASSEENKGFLEKELKRLMGEKAELERQFNDLTVLKAQVAKLKEEMNVARRIEWGKQGLFARAEQKGAQQLLQGANAPQTAQAKTPKPAYDLNVEIAADGSVRVVPPATNAPTSAPAPK